MGGGGGFFFFFFFFFFICPVSWLGCILSSTNGSPPPRPEPGRAPVQSRPPATRSSCEIRTSRATAAWTSMARSQHSPSGSVRASAAAAAAARGSAEAGSWCGSSGRRNTTARPGRAARRVRPRGRTLAPLPAATRHSRVNQRRPKEPVLRRTPSHTRSHESMRPDRPHRAALRTGARLVRAAPAKKPRRA